MLFRKKSKRLQRNLKSFRNKQIDLGKYVRDFYLENGVAYISCNVQGFYDVINRYSVREYEWLNPEFTDFIEQNAYCIPVEYPIVLEICGVDFTEKEKAVIQETVTDYYSLQLGNRQLDLEDNTRHCLTKLITAILIGTFYFSMNALGLATVVVETASIFFWVFLWDFIDLFLTDRRDVKDQKTEAAQLASIKCIFSKKFKDEVLDEQIADEFIAEIIDVPLEEVIEEKLEDEDTVSWVGTGTRE